jgi:hypothetical protein
MWATRQIDVRKIARGCERNRDYFENGRIQEAACWAHVRRKFFDLMEAHRSPIATEAVQRIGVLYQIESEIRGRSPDARRAVRQARSRPLLDAMRVWLSRHGPTSWNSDRVPHFSRLSRSGKVAACAFEIPLTSNRRTMSKLCSRRTGSDSNHKWDALKLNRYTPAKFAER